VTIASPAAGAVVIGTASVAVNASDNVGVASVRLSVDGIAVATSTTAPYALQWTTTTASAGLHVLTVTAFDGAGNHAADSVNVTVADQFAPSALITSPTSGARDTSTKTISVSASDNVGVNCRDAQDQRAVLRNRPDRSIYLLGTGHCPAVRFEHSGSPRLGRSQQLWKQQILLFR